ncbi:MAG: hypothetical protein H7Y43_05950 [Akkermansiaceae bacterium]|nr:hypothetical protein [Verrucomicrobiales bacterium]
MVIPIEILARELDGKLLLASCAKERGWNVIIGGMAAVKNAVPHLPPFVFFAKSARSTNAKLFARLKRLGHEVVVLDEEGLVRQSDDIYLMKHEKDALKNVDLLLTWGDDSRDLWRRSGMLGGVPAEATGNPRVDMVRPRLRAYHQEDIRAIHQRFGEYVIFNSNFGTINNKVTGGERFNLAEWAEGGVKTDAAAYLEHKRAIFERFRALMPKVAAAIAPLNLIIRPHPAEDHAVWKDVAAGIANIHVVFEGSVVPWIAAARILIHNGCTSAVEAAIEGTTVISYRPVTSERYDNPLPNAVGIECFSDEELLARMQKILKTGHVPLTAKQSALLHRFVALEDAMLCSDAVFDAIDRNSIGFAPKRKVPFHTWFKIYLQHQRQLLPQRLKKLLPGNSRRKEYKKHKFSGLTEDMVNTRIDRLEAALSRFSGIRARVIGGDLIELK